MYSFLYTLIIVFCSLVSHLLIWYLALSSTVFIAVLILLLLFVVNVGLLLSIGQFIYALFLLGIYVGAILVFFVFVIMSFVFFGNKENINVLFGTVVYILCIIYILFYFNYNGLVLYNSFFYYNVIYSVHVVSFNELLIAGFLLFSFEQMYLVLIVSLLLFIALVGSITFNVTSVVRYSSLLYKLD